MVTQLVRKCIQILFPDSPVQPTARLLARPQFVADTTYLLPYQEQSVQTAIKQNKYHQDQHAAAALAAVLDQYLGSVTADTLTIIPVPQSYKRWRERGFDHLTEILQHSQYRDRLHKRIVTKSTHTKRQAHVSKPQRLQQQAGTYRCRTSAASQLRGTVVLFDDVVTTGSTMNAVRATLAPHLHPDTRLICLALAH